MFPIPKLVIKIIASCDIFYVFREKICQKLPHLSEARLLKSKRDVHYYAGIIALHQELIFVVQNFQPKEVQLRCF
jgi:hypothetical protein